MVARRSALGMRVLGVVFAVVALSDVWDILSTFLGWNDEPTIILLLHGLMFLLASTAAVGLWRSTRWAAAAVLLWGLAIAAFIVGLGPILSLDAEERRGLWVGGGSLLAFAVVVAAYAHYRVRGALVADERGPSNV